MGTLFQFPDETAILQEWFKTGTMSQLVGFETEREDAKWCAFNFIMSNGTRSSAQRDEHVDSDEDWPPRYDHMIPKDAIERTRSVSICHCHETICAFSGFDKDGAPLWEFGDFPPLIIISTEKVVLEENEVIVGVVAKRYYTALTDF